MISQTLIEQIEDEQNLSRLMLDFRDALYIALGCKDYCGGYHDSNQEVYQHGIQTVINALQSAYQNGIKDTQVFALHQMGLNAAHRSKE